MEKEDNPKLIWQVIALIGMIIIIVLMVWMLIKILHLPKDPCQLCEQMYGKNCVAIPRLIIP